MILECCTRQPRAFLARKMSGVTRLQGVLVDELPGFKLEHGLQGFSIHHHGMAGCCRLNDHEPGAGI